jgi:hypothetical protein
MVQRLVHTAVFCTRVRVNDINRAYDRFCVLRVFVMPFNNIVQVSGRIYRRIVLEEGIKDFQ